MGKEMLQDDQKRTKKIFIILVKLYLLQLILTSIASNQ